MAESDRTEAARSVCTRLMVEAVEVMAYGRWLLVLGGYMVVVVVVCVQLGEMILGVGGVCVCIRRSMWW